MDRIQVEDLNIQFGDVTAVRSATFGVRSGEVFGLLGGNGAGKSSTLRAVAGVNPVRSGRLWVAGYDMADPREVEKGRSALGFCPDVGGLIGTATIREHIELALSFHGRRDLTRQSHVLVDRFELGHVMDRITGGFSHGMKRRLSVLLAALVAQEVLVLDEPFDGVDPIGVRATLDVVNQAASAGLAVVISTHLLSLQVQACDRIAVMVNGTLVEAQQASAYAGEAGIEHTTTC